MKKTVLSKLIKILTSLDNKESPINIKSGVAFSSLGEVTVFKQLTPEEKNEIPDGISFIAPAKITSFLGDITISKSPDGGVTITGAKGGTYTSTVPAPIAAPEISEVSSSNKIQIRPFVSAKPLCFSYGAKTAAAIKLISEMGYISGEVSPSDKAVTISTTADKALAAVVKAIGATEYSISINNNSVYLVNGEYGIILNAEGIKNPFTSLIENIGDVNGVSIDAMSLVSVSSLSVKENWTININDNKFQAATSAAKAEVEITNSGITCKAVLTPKAIQMFIGLIEDAETINIGLSKDSKLIVISASYTRLVIPAIM